MKSDKYIDLVQLFGEFIGETGSDNLREFSVWLLRRTESSSSVKTAKPNTADTDRTLAYLMNRLAKYSRFYSKKVLAEFGLTSIDEFYFLLSVFRLNNPSKNEVYTDTITELTTGAQIMRRLIDMKLLEEYTDKQDKRIKRVKLTKKGDKVRIAVFNRFTDTVKIKSGNLSAEEKAGLLKSLQYLEDFHRTVFVSDRESTVEEIIQKYLR